MSFENRRNLLIVFITLLIIFESIAYVATTPRPREQFFQLYILGSNHLAADYYPNGNPDITLGEPVSWYIGTTNLMGDMQLVAIRVKLGNQTISSPDDLQALASPAPTVTEFKRFIQDNETWETPFVWRVSNASTTQSSTRIIELQINNETYELSDSSALNGRNFRLIFELWSWDTKSAALQFGWQTGNERRVAWLQLWFNMTSPAR
jgi:uncharacterized membrane protein